MKVPVSAVMSFVLMTAISGILSFSQQPQNEPTRQEIEQAYRSKSGEGGTFIPGLQWERWRIKEIRGWKLRFKRIAQERSPGVITLKYQAVAKKNGSCAHYQITDTMIFPPNNVQLKPILVVDPNGVNSCR
jgi:hypothetical protein